MRRSSSIAWLASSQTEIGRARDILRALTQQGVLDELGFLVLLGALSDRLYPAINTIMTRARYLVFVPAIYRHLEDRQAVRKTNARAATRNLQFDLRNALYETDAGAQGIIGRDAGHDIARPPSNVYWNALADLRIATRRISESAYLDHLSSQKSGDKQFKDDDKVVHLGDSDSLWSELYRSPGVISDKGSFAAGTSFSLTKPEAIQLRRCYDSVRPDGGTSLLSHLIALGAGQGDWNVIFDWPWRVPDQPPDLRRLTEHARCLSLLARGAQLQYHAMLFAKRGQPDPGTAEAFSAWFSIVKPELVEWDVEDFGALPCVSRAPRVGDVAFLSNWRDAIVKPLSASAAYRDANSRDLLARREAAMRGHKARLRGGFHLKTWIAPDSYKPNAHYALSYRHQVGTQFASDIVAGLIGASD